MFSQQSTSLDIDNLENILKIATCAKDYANHKIVKGSTHVKNNDLDNNRFISLANIVKDMRDVGKSIERQKIDTCNCPHELYLLIHFETKLEMSAKYFLGNCYELSLHALDYVLDNASDIFAEVYKIHNGDHVFLVLNRRRGSVANDPSTWGNKAVICDPWSNKVYLASDYLGELKNYYNLLAKVNCLENFNPKIHSLLPMSYLNSDYLQSARSIHAKNIKINLNNILTPICAVLQKYNRLLMTEKIKLLSKLGNGSVKANIVESKIQKISLMIAKLKNQQLDVSNNHNYKQLKKLASALSINHVFNDAIHVMQFTPQGL